MVEKATQNKGSNKREAIASKQVICRIYLLFFCYLLLIASLLADMQMSQKQTQNSPETGPRPSLQVSKMWFRGLGEIFAYLLICLVKFLKLALMYE